MPYSVHGLLCSTTGCTSDTFHKEFLGEIFFCCKRYQKKHTSFYKQNFVMKNVFSENSYRMVSREAVQNHTKLETPINLVSTVFFRNQNKQKTLVKKRLDCSFQAINVHLDLGFILSNVNCPLECPNK